jgi:hypothetical protein
VGDSERSQNKLFYGTHAKLIKAWMEGVGVLVFESERREERLGALGPVVGMVFGGLV